MLRVNIFYAKHHPQICLKVLGWLNSWLLRKKIHPFDLIMFINTGSSQLFTGIPGFDG